MASLGVCAALTGAGLMLVEGDTEWELLAYRDVELLGPDLWRVSGLLRGLAGSQPVAGDSERRIVLLDSRVATVPVSSAETGLEMMWQSGDGAPDVLTYEDQAGRPWRVGHLRVQSINEDSVASWTRRGGDVSDSWFYPEVDNAGHFRVVGLSNGVTVSTDDVAVASMVLPSGIDELRVAEIGADLRLGPWASIPL